MEAGVRIRRPVSGFLGHLEDSVRIFKVYGGWCQVLLSIGRPVSGFPGYLEESVRISLVTGGLLDL
jgi:hypothetical protein